MNHGISRVLVRLFVRAFNVSGALALILFSSFGARAASVTATGTRVEWSNATGEWKNTTFTFSATYEIEHISCLEGIYEIRITSLTTTPGPNRAKGYWVGGTVVAGVVGQVGERRRVNVPLDGTPVVFEYGVVTNQDVGMQSGGAGTVTLNNTDQQIPLVCSQPDIEGQPGDVVTGQILGAGGGYLAVVEDGGDAQVTIDTDTGEFSVTIGNVPSLIGFFAASQQCKNYLPAVAVVVPVEAPKCVAWSVSPGASPGYATLINESLKYTYTVRREGEVIATKEVSWGAREVIRVSGLTGVAPASLYVTRWTSGMVWDESLSIWRKSNLEVAMEVMISTQVPSAHACVMVNPDDVSHQVVQRPDIVNPVDPDNPGGTNPMPKIGGNDPTLHGKDEDGQKKKAGGSIWNTTVIEGGQVREEVFVEGISKLDRQLEAVNSRLDALIESASGSGSNAAAIAEAAEAGAEAGAEAEGEAAGAANQVAQAFSVGESTPTLSLPSGHGGGLLIAGAYGVTINLDPASDSVVASIAGFLKQVIIWIVSIVFAWWLWCEFAGVVRDLHAAQQARGNAVIGGTGGQVTALVAAAAITAVLVVVPLSYWAFAGGHDVIPVTDVSGPAGISLYLLFFFVPVTYILTVVTTAFVIRKAGIVMIAATATLIRFIVP